LKLSLSFYVFTHSVYLKTNGINPHDHPVMNEMKRVKSYFDKISEGWCTQIE